MALKAQVLFLAPPNQLSNHLFRPVSQSNTVVRFSERHDALAQSLITEEPSSSLYNRWIRANCQTGRIDDAMALVADMEALGSRPDPISYVRLIETLVGLGRTLEAESLFYETVRSGFHAHPRLNSRLYNILLRGYLKKGLLEMATRVLGLMHKEKVVKSRETYEILLDYCVKAGRLEDSWSLVNEMKVRGFELNFFVYSKIITLYRDNGMWKKAIGIVEEIRQLGIPMDLQIYNTIIDTFGKYGLLAEALQIFENMKVNPNITTWSALIRWHCRHGELEKALGLFTRMQEQGLYPDPKVLVNLIAKLGEKGKWDLIKSNFEMVKCRGHKHMGAIYAVLADIYGQYGGFRDAEVAVAALKSEGLSPTANVFCALANAYAQQGLCEQTVKVLRIMENDRIEPNLTMLNVLVNAFGTAGQHREALLVYNHIKECGYSPDVVTYSTLMKAFIRAKKYEKVTEIYKEMESSGCSPDRKARQLLQSAEMVLEKKK